jgi:O-succinylbenzoate synthase
VKIRIHHYTLQPGPDPARAARTAHHGALLKVEFDNDTTGYADLHPWEEFGHSPLSEHLTSLKIETPTPLANLALRHARTDAAARRAGVSLFDGLPEVRSHALFTDWTNAPRSVFERCAAEGYTAAKLKIGQNPEREAEALNQLADLPLRWRLDANASFTTGGASIDHFRSALHPSIHQNIEFLEDPFPYNPAAWAELSSHAKLPLALDWELPAPAARMTLRHPTATGTSTTATSTMPPWPGAQILVIKPASQDAFPLALAAAHAGMELVVTHSMDHPLGQSVALWTAMRLRQRHGDLVRDGGLQATGLYQPDNFTTQLQTAGPRTIPPPGTGFGFDELLAQLPWALLH